MSKTARLEPEIIRVGVVIVLGAIMSILDTTIVAVALRTLSHDFRVDVSTIQWVTTGYLLALAVVIPVSGWAIHRIGAKPVYMISLGFFITGSAMSGLAWSATSLILFRVFQGLGGGMILPVGQSILARTAGPQRMGQVMGIIGVPQLLGPILGPVIGGVIISNTSWRWIFFVNVPLIALIVALTPVVITESRAPTTGGRFDLAGPVLATSGLLALVLGIIRTDALGWGSSEVVGLLLAALGLLLAFVVVESRRRHPMLPLPLFRSRALSLGNVMLALNGGTILAVFYLNTTYLQLVRHESAFGAGMSFLPMGIGAIIGAVVAGQIVTRVGTRPVQLAGAILTALGLAWSLRVGVTSSYPSTLLVSFLLFGVGITSLGVPTQVGAVAHVDHHNAGVSSGLLNASYQIGGAIGLATLTTLTTSRVVHLLGAGEAPTHALAGGYHLGVMLALGLAVANGVVALLSPSVTPTAEMIRSMGA